MVEKIQFTGGQFLLVRDVKILILVLFLVSLASFLTLQLLNLFRYNPVWWDEAVYIGMGKNIFSAGKAGFWEPFRPLVLPILSGFFWKAGLEPIFHGRVLALVFSLGSIYLTYVIGKEVFDERVAFVAATLLVLTPIFYNFSSLWLSDIPSTFFALAAIYFFIKGQKTRSLILSGLFLALAALTRFPQGVLLFVFGAVVFFYSIKPNRKAKKFRLRHLEFLRQFAALLLGFFLLTSPYLIFNYFKYGSSILPFLQAYTKVTTTAKWYGTGVLFYLKELLLQNYIFVFAFVGIIYFLAIRDFDYKKMTVVFALLAFFAYFTYLTHKEARYALVFLPYLAMISSYGLLSLGKIISKFFGLRPAVFFLFTILFIFLSSSLFQQLWQIKFFRWREPEIVDAYYRYFKYNPTDAIIYSTSPVISAYVDNRIQVLDSSVDGAANIYASERKNMQFVALNDCELLCMPNDVDCLLKKESFINNLLNESEELFYRNEGGCKYYILQLNKI